MQTLPAVEEAKSLLNEAKDWSIMKWLTEKRRVRSIADRGTAALDELERKIKGTWAEDLRTAYALLVRPSADEDDPFAQSEYEFVKQQAADLSPQILAVVQQVKDVDDRATQARLTAERTFDDAERRLSAALARRGAEEAILAFDLRYEAIAAAQALVKRAK